MNLHTINLLPKQKELEILYINNLNIEGILCLKNFPHLRKLFCANNRISQLINLPESLEFINCSNNNINELELSGQIIKLIIEYNPIESLIMSDCNFFNYSIKYPNSIKILHFGCGFNRPIKLPEFTTDLIFGDNFNQPILLTRYIDRLIFGHQFNQYVIIPNSVTYLYFGLLFNQNLFVPNSVIELCLSSCFSSNLILSDGLINLTYMGCYM